MAEDRGDDKLVRQEWYAGAMEVLGPLRWHLNELLEAMEAHNRYARAVGAPLLPERKIEAAKKANRAADTYFSFSGDDG